MKNYQQYERIPFDDNNLPIRINYNSILSPDNTVDTVPLSWHDQIELLRFHSGSALVYCNDKTYTAEAGDLFLFNPNEMHRVVFCDSVPCFDCIMIDAALYNSKAEKASETHYFDLLSDLHVCFENRIRQNATAIAHVDALCKEWSQKAFGYELAVKAHVFALFTELFRHHVYSHSTFRQMVDNIERYNRIKPALALMSSHTSERISLEAMAQSCNLSASHFCRLFRQITGLTPSQYLLDVRLQKAVTLLKNTDKTVSQVAFEVGFDDAGYFTRRFKSAFGMTPTEAKRHYS